MFPIFSKSKRPTYTAAIIGLGRIGYSLALDKKREQPASHTAALAENDRIKLIAGCDTDLSRAEEWHTANYPLPAYLNTANLFARHKPDIVTVAVNEDNHLKVALEAINAKPKLLILEKPVALCVKDALLIKEEAEKNGVPILINHERRFAEDYAIARMYMKKIGEIQSVNALLSSSLKVYDKAEESTGNYSLIHDGTHLVDIVQFLLEELLDEDETKKEEVAQSGLLSKAQKTLRRPILQKPTVRGIWKDENGSVRNLTAVFETSVCPLVTIGLSGRSNYFGFDIDIRGTQGRILIGNGYLNVFKSAPSTLYTGFKSLSPDSAVKMPQQTLYFSNMVQNAVDFLDGKASLKSTLQNGIDALSILEEIKNMIS